MERPKLELLDDPTRTGVYELTVTIHNTGSEALTYQASPHRPNRRDRALFHSRRPNRTDNHGDLGRAAPHLHHQLAKRPGHRPGRRTG